MSSENNSKIIRLNPQGVPSPVGKYAHVTIIPKNSDLYTFSGQIGIDDKGHIPEEFNAQVHLTFNNIAQLLKSQELMAEDIIKVNIWSTQEIDWSFFDAEWQKLFDEHYPSMTIAYISALGLPELKIEIEIWAAKQ